MVEGSGIMLRCTKGGGEVDKGMRARACEWLY